MHRPTFVYVTYIATSPEKLWSALTDGQFTRRYWGGMRIQSEWKVGAPVKHIREDGGTGLQGKVLQSDPPRLLSYTFQVQISDKHRGEQPSRVTFELQPFGPIVKLTLTHEDFAPDSANHEFWPAIMSSLKSLLETGSPLPFTRLGFAPSNHGLGQR